MALRRAAGAGWLDLLRDTAPGIALQPDQRVEGEPARGYVVPAAAPATPRARSATAAALRAVDLAGHGGVDVRRLRRLRRAPAGPTTCSRARWSTTDSLSG